MPEIRHERRPGCRLRHSFAAYMMLGRNLNESLLAQHFALHSVNDPTQEMAFGPFLRRNQARDVHKLQNDHQRVLNSFRSDICTKPNVWCVKLSNCQSAIRGRCIPIRTGSPRDEDAKRRPSAVCQLFQEDCTTTTAYLDSNTC
jgi:hypothetical protein